MKSFRRITEYRRKIHYKYIRLFKRIYRLMDIPPIKSGGDCGYICGRKCCKPRKNWGIYLYPHEYHITSDFPGSFRWEKSGRSYFIKCDGVCRREKRPLQCRVYPLKVILQNGKILMIKNSFGNCPIKNDKISPEFIKACLKAFKILIKCHHCSLKV